MSHPTCILLDTPVIIDLGEVDFGPYESAVPAVSTISVAELTYGLDTDDPIERRTRIERYRAVLEQFDVLAFNTGAAEIYGTMAAVVRRADRNPRPRRMDLLIAATTSAYAMPMLTRNPDDFAGVEVTGVEVVG